MLNFALQGSGLSCAMTPKLLVQLNDVFHFHQSLDKCLFCRCYTVGYTCSDFMNVYVFFDKLERYIKK